VLGPLNVIWWEKMGNVLLAFGSVVVVVPATAAAAK
jgi:hypothetical protein